MNSNDIGSIQDITAFENEVKKVSNELQATDAGGHWAVRKPNGRRPQSEIDNRFMAAAREMVLMLTSHIKHLTAELTDLRKHRDLAKSCVDKAAEDSALAEERVQTADAILRAAAKALAVRKPGDPDYVLELRKITETLMASAQNEREAGAVLAPDGTVAPEVKKEKKEFVEIFAYEKVGMSLHLINDRFLWAIDRCLGRFEEIRNTVTGEHSEYVATICNKMMSTIVATRESLGANARLNNGALKCCAECILHVFGDMNARVSQEIWDANYAYLHPLEELLRFMEGEVKA